MLATNRSPEFSSIEGRVIDCRGLSMPPTGPQEARAVAGAPRTEAARASPTSGRGQRPGRAGSTTGASGAANRTAAVPRGNVISGVDGANTSDQRRTTSMRAKSRSGLKQMNAELAARSSHEDGSGLRPLRDMLTPRPSGVLSRGALGEGAVRLTLSVAPRHRKRRPRRWKTSRTGEVNLMGCRFQSTAALCAPSIRGVKSGVLEAEHHCTMPVLTPRGADAGGDRRPATRDPPNSRRVARGVDRNVGRAALPAAYGRERLRHRPAGCQPGRRKDLARERLGRYCGTSQPWSTCRRRRDGRCVRSRQRRLGRSSTRWRVTPWGARSRVAKAGPRDLSTTADAYASSLTRMLERSAARMDSIHGPRRGAATG